MNRDKIKFQIAKVLENGNRFEGCETYDEAINSIYDNLYRTILKVPTVMCIHGILGHFKIDSLQMAQEILAILKEVIVESLQLSGVELTFTDGDWDSLEIIENENYGKGWVRKDERYILKNECKEKGYLSEFFEL